MRKRVPFCKRCGGVFPSLSELWHHLRDECPGTQCPACGSMDWKMWERGGTRCKRCGEPFPGERPRAVAPPRLSREEVYRCEECGQRFTDRASLQDHRFFCSRTGVSERKEKAVRKIMITARGKERSDEHDPFASF